ncbi:putative EamA domain-containing protein [Medicago truncatula]|uniref:WAT1-related protein n=1 Tax=Medicago truncatula TaxID=3880 RepID=G7K2S0_MEDTR|nr:WAT1-related protein At4g15540 [Medicago truncatula]AES96246.2 auxin-induced 5NG4-like protein [Medicago truncatula]RHN55091.1 putative EamA domain-containing protein [Medicago truncatula]
MVTEGGVTAIMIVTQFVEVGGDTLMKSATKDGMSIFIFIFYSNILALCFLLPSTLFHHRKRSPPPISTSIFCRMLLLSCLFTAVQILMNTGIGYSSPTLASAMVDLVPAFTFILAVISRMEVLNMKKHSSQAKIIGTLVSIVGALTVTLYKGMPLINGAFQNIEMGATEIYLLGKSDWIIGAFLLATASFLLSVLFITETWTIKAYPEELLVTSICISLVVIQSGIVALIVEGNSNAWILKPNKELVAVCFSAIFVVSLRSVVNKWAFRKKGPIYVAMFNPLRVVIALGMGILFLGNNLYLGSMIGASIIVIGFYAVMWAQAQEEHTTSENDFLPSSSTPLLSTKNIDH